MLFFKADNNWHTGLLYGYLIKYLSVIWRLIKIIIYFTIFFCFLVKNDHLDERTCTQWWTNYYRNMSKRILMSNTAVLEQLQLKPHTGVVPGMVCSVFLKILRKLDKWRIQDYMIRNGVSGKFNCEGDRSRKT